MLELIGKHLTCLTRRTDKGMCLDRAIMMGQGQLPSEAGSREGKGLLKNHPKIMAGNFVKLMGRGNGVVFLGNLPDS